MKDLFDEEQLKRLLIDPYEDLGAEYKSWLELTDSKDRATLAKALLAMANHGGGYVVIGFIPNHPLEPDLQCNVNRSKYNSDTINDIVAKFADPPFQCQLRMIKHPTHNMEFAIILVPGEHSVPIRCKASGPDGSAPQTDKYYIRRPGPSSEPPQSAKEWGGCPIFS